MANTLTIQRHYQNVFLFIIIGLITTSIISLCLLFHIDGHLSQTNDNSVKGFHFVSTTTKRFLLLRSNHENQFKKKSREKKYPIMINFYYSSNPYDDDDAIMSRDYNNLTSISIANFTIGRIMKQNNDDNNDGGHVYNFTIDGDDYIEPYYAFDDDYIRHPTCARVSWHRLNYPNCNIFHEITNIHNTVTLINSGYYRDVMKFTDKVSSETLILKTIRLSLGYGYDSYEYTRIDALIMERLASSPRIADIFGFCGTSSKYRNIIHASMTIPLMLITICTVIQEAFVADLNSKILRSKNNKDNKQLFSPKNKLEIALSMAEAIADLHGYKDGIIIHDDIQLSQYLFTTKNKIKLNDFNRVEIMLYDTKKQDYCKYYNGKGYGNYRSPEEFMDHELNEKIDVWSLGNNFYSLLTNGLWIFYNINTKNVDIQDLIINGTTSYIDPKYKSSNSSSYEERTLVSIIEKCWTYNPDHRIDIFEIVAVLKNALKIK